MEHTCSRVFTMEYSTNNATALPAFYKNLNYVFLGFINSFLTTPLVQILSKLTFCIYLIHGLLVTYESATSKNLLETGQFAGVSLSFFTTQCNQ